MSVPRRYTEILCKNIPNDSYEDSV